MAEKFAMALAPLRIDLTQTLGFTTKYSGGSMKIKLVAAALTVICLPTLAQESAYGGYSGHGGMTAYKIEPNVYEYHYDNGFTGPDAMGWDPGLQFAWSRIAAAEICGLKIDKDTALTSLELQYRHSRAIQEMVGVGFHASQIKANQSFCTESRMQALKELIPAIEDGSFEVSYK